ncbi:MAG: DUF3388 domain-containing protein [Hydrogenibacillus schlegelii]|nr:DUF3388 domain-containing protein [Hydrogenibacillus schlegelii]
MPMPDEAIWYLEYHIAVDRPGLLGDVASLIGMLSINIHTISGVDARRRGLLIECADEEKLELLARFLHVMPNITVTALRRPTLLDRLAIRHGRYVEQDARDRKTFRFLRDDLGLLVDFLGEILKHEPAPLIGVRGSPRVGKTEAAVAASVYAGKRWIVVSSTLLRQTMRTSLLPMERDADAVYLIDALVTFYRGTEEHQAFVRELLRSPRPKIVEHPDVLVHETEWTWNDFDYVIEIRTHPGEAIATSLHELRERSGDF